MGLGSRSPCWVSSGNKSHLHLATDSPNLGGLFTKPHRAVKIRHVTFHPPLPPRRVTESTIAGPRPFYFHSFLAMNRLSYRISVWVSFAAMGRESRAIAKERERWMCITLTSDTLVVAQCRRLHVPLANSSRDAALTDWRAERLRDVRRSCRCSCTLHSFINRVRDYAPEAPEQSPTPTEFRTHLF